MSKTVNHAKKVRFSQAGSHLITEIHIYCDIAVCFITDTVHGCL